MLKRFRPTRKDTGNDTDGADEARPLINEQTRLLPNRLDSDVVYLSPDDPAVSPYNLWSVRLVRYATVVLMTLTLIWWTLMLVSAFVTPPGLHARGSAWLAFGYSSIALTTLVITLVFFAAPSKAARVLSILMALFLAVDTIIVLSVERTRHEELWVGATSVVWALLISLWALVADHTVQWGKREEEERLTGRVESRRTASEWAQVVTSTLALSILTLALVLMTSTLILRATDASLAPPGKMYWVDGDQYQVHLYCYGNSTGEKGNKVPTVLLQAGEQPVEYGLWQFAENAVKNGSIARFCFSDRPGVAWSDAAPSPLSAGIATDALSEALAQAGEHGPWIVVSAGIGSLYSRVFSARHGKEVQSMLMIDPLHEDLLDRVAAAGRGFGFWLSGVLSPLGLGPLTGALFRGRTAVDRVWGRSGAQSGKAIFAKLQESLVAESLTRRDVLSSRAIQYRNTPVVVVSSGEQIRRDSVWEEKQRDLTSITAKLAGWDIVDKAPHRVWDTLEGREVIEKRLRQLSKKA